MGEALGSILAWDDAGPVAILMFMLVMLTLLSRWLFKTLLETKNAQIARLEAMNDKLSDETAETLRRILESLRAARSNKESADV